MSAAPPPLVALLLLVTAVPAQKVRFGQCPHLEPVSDFNVLDFAGLWYENRKFPTWRGFGKSCVTAEYHYLGDGVMYVENSALAAFGIQHRLRGYGFFTGPTWEARLAVGFPEPTDRTEPNYVVLKTDYQSYAVVHSCRDLVGAHVEYLWLLTRQPKVDKRLVLNIVKDLARHGIEAHGMVPTAQHFCQYGYQARQSP